MATTNTNGYTGGTTLTAGTLSFVHGALGSGNITFSGNGALQYHGSNTQDVSGTLVISNGTTANIDTNGNQVTYATRFGNGSSGNLNKAGNGALILAAAEGYSGSTTVSQGTLQLGTGASGQDGSLASGLVNVASGANLVYDVNGSQTGLIIAGSGSVGIVRSRIGDPGRGKHLHRRFECDQRHLGRDVQHHLQPRRRDEPGGDRQRQRSGPRRPPRPATASPPTTPPLA